MLVPPFRPPCLLQSARRRNLPGPVWVSGERLFPNPSMKRWHFKASLFASALLFFAGWNDPASAADKKYTIALMRVLTTDAFYITMHKGAKAAADALGVELVFQGAPKFDPEQQVPVLNAVIGRKPDAILIAPTDKTQLVSPLKNAAGSGISVITVDTFIGTGHYQTGSGDADFPLSYIASDNIWGGRIAARVLAKGIGEEVKGYASKLQPNISTTDQRDEWLMLAIQQ